MFSSEHRRPLAAFLLVFGFACVVLANGLREQVVRVFVDSGAPRPLISAVVPDIVLGHSLRNAPAKAPATAAAAEVPATNETRPILSRAVTLAAQVTSTPAASTKPATSHPHRSAHVKHHAATAKPAHVAAPTAP